MRITGLDLETTGLDAEDGHRIIEVCLVEYDLDTRKRLAVCEEYVNPERSIPVESFEIHGISSSKVAGKETWKVIYPKHVKPILERADKLIIHNADFDSVFLAHEILRIGHDIPDVDAFCTMENARWATFNGKAPNLGELCFALDVEYDPEKAHSAVYDVDVMMKCLFKGLDLGFYDLGKA